MNITKFDGTSEGHFLYFKEFYKHLIEENKFPITFENTTPEEREQILHIHKVCGTKYMKQLFTDAVNELKIEVEK